MNNIILATTIKIEDFLIIMLIVIALGIFLFFLTGIVKIRKGSVGIIERLGLYVGTYQEGFHYFAPLIYRRVGMYKLGVTNRDVSVSRYDTATITYEITNVKLFHYSGHDFDGIVKIVYRDHASDKDKFLKEYFEKVGVKYISLSEKSIR